MLGIGLNKDTRPGGYEGRKEERMTKTTKREFAAMGVDDNGNMHLIGMPLNSESAASKAIDEYQKNVKRRPDNYKAYPLYKIASRTVAIASTDWEVVSIPE